jgi:hypothetical protein
MPSRSAISLTVSGGGSGKNRASALRLRASSASSRAYSSPSSAASPDSILPSRASSAHAYEGRRRATSPTVTERLKQRSDTFLHEGEDNALALRAYRAAQDSVRAAGLSDVTHCHAVATTSDSPPRPHRPPTRYPALSRRPIRAASRRAAGTGPGSQRPLLRHSHSSRPRSISGPMFFFKPPGASAQIGSISTP